MIKNILKENAPHWTGRLMKSFTSLPARSRFGKGRLYGLTEEEIKIVEGE
ncbi:MAG: hypothetical protein Q7S39_08505 [Ignavibacteria bacterium]|nr:hypothetical protein [Ignavibacteria bacterium]